MIVSLSFLPRLASWLRCPVCANDLAPAGALSLRCDNGHSFDANKRGFLTTLDRSRGIEGDTREILTRRSEFLALGHYSPIAAAVVDAIPTSVDAVLDSGCGTGYYLRALLDARPQLDALCFDASADAVSAAVASTSAPRLVGDVWLPLAVRDARADAVLCVFAPRNADEFARLLRPGGTLVVVTPTPRHLAQLRDAGAMIGLQSYKLERLDATLAGRFTLGERTGTEYELQLAASELDLLIGMGPSGHHDREPSIRGAEVTVSVDVSVYDLH